MRELELIEDLAGLLHARDARVTRWLGDDAAVTRTAGAYAVTSVDAMVDGIHFRCGQLSWPEIGHRALAAALSDLAAMGVAASEAYMALGIPAGTARADCAALIGGIDALAERSRVTICGGDITRAPALSVAFTAVGYTDDPGGVLGRDGARPGDLVGVTGTLGGASAGLALIEGRLQLPEGIARGLRERYARPQPRLAAGRALAQAGASAMIDLSDGLATDAAHVGRASEVRLALELGRLPLAPGLTEAGRRLSRPAAELAATGGDDYELCMCAPPGACSTLEAAVSSADPSARISWIGRVIESAPGASFIDAATRLEGYEHEL